MDVTSLRYMTSIQSQELETQRQGSSSIESSFATALREEIAQLREEPTTDSLLDASDSLNLGEISEMMGSASGRQAISAMAEASLNSLIFTGTTDNDQMNLLESLLQDDQSVQQEVADTLEQILNRLEEGHVISE